MPEKNRQRCRQHLPESTIKQRSLSIVVASNSDRLRQHAILSRFTSLEKLGHRQAQAPPPTSLRPAARRQTWEEVNPGYEGQRCFMCGVRTDLSDINGSHTFFTCTELGDLYPVRTIAEGESVRPCRCLLTAPPLPAVLGLPSPHVLVHIDTCFCAVERRPFKRGLQSKEVCRRMAQANACFPAAISMLESTAKTSSMARASTPTPTCSWASTQRMAASTDAGPL